MGEMKLIPREAWGAKPPNGSYTPRTLDNRGTVHYSASGITPTGRSGTRSAPEKPGAKWYRIWRNKATPVLQRRKISRMISEYNKSLKVLGGGAFVMQSVRDQEKAIMRGFQAFHQGPSRGWVDIGYHRVCFASGNVYEGRPIGVMGAHAHGANDTLGFCFVMTDGDKMTSYMKSSFNAMAKVDGVTAWKGHRQRPGNSTSCPGDAVMRALNL